MNKSHRAPTDRHAPWIRAYERLCPTDLIADDDPRRGPIANEMRALRCANSLKKGIEVIGWWDANGWYDTAERDRFIRSAMVKLRRSKSLRGAAANEQSHS